MLIWTNSKAPEESYETVTSALLRLVGVEFGTFCQQCRQSTSDDRGSGPGMLKVDKYVHDAMKLTLISDGYGWTLRDKEDDE